MDNFFGNGAGLGQAGLPGAGSFMSPLGFLPPSPGIRALQGETRLQDLFNPLPISTNTLLRQQGLGRRKKERA